MVNQMVVRDLAEELGSVEGMVIVSYGGLTVAENERMRNELAEKGAKLRMVPNRLARRALKERGLEVSREAMSGNTAIAYGSTESALGAAKVFTHKDVKKLGKVEFRGALLEGAILSAQAAEALADVPDRDTLHSMLLGVIQGPARGLTTVINAVPSGLARVLQARADQLGEAG
jgi:large subunit ribosomal protein L10